jgi:hypothetical protein
MRINLAKALKRRYNVNHNCNEIKLKHKKKYNYNYEKKKYEKFVKIIQKKKKVCRKDASKNWYMRSLKKKVIIFKNMMVEEKKCR